MRARITLNGSEDAGAGYLGWAPAPARVRLEDAGGGADPVRVRLRNVDPSQGGQVAFLADLSDEPAEELTLELPASGEPVDFFVAGRFLAPSLEDGDAGIAALADDGADLGSRRLMVRVRKNAESLTDAERDRFLIALGTLNDQGFGVFQQYRDMHADDTSIEAHGNAGFLPWHRAYLLDLERELQAIDPSVALPYWRFDQPAPRLFSTDFIGVSDRLGVVQVDPANPLKTWTTDGQVGIRREPLFDPRVMGARQELFPGFVRSVLDESATLDLGGPGAIYDLFRDMEGNPHGRAHTSFFGYISDIETAARDPLFFLLHANVDRLWAKWQWFHRRFDPTSSDTYTFLGAAGSTGATRIGHNLRDPMWPWNQIMTSPRPSTAPGGRFPGSATTAAPGLEPEVGSMIAWQGNGDPAVRLGFDYDDVPWEA